jgi:hypothetical protein
MYNCFITNVFRMFFQFTNLESVVLYSHLLSLQFIYNHDDHMNIILNIKKFFLERLLEFNRQKTFKLLYWKIIPYDLAFHSC